MSDNKVGCPNMLVDIDYTRKDLPYCVDINEKLNEIYGINRDYEYMNSGTKCLSDIVEDSNDFTRHYLYDDGCVPYKHNKPNKHTKKYIDNLKTICTNKKFINMNNSIQSILQM
jgi:hypothetical protein